jgi:hypothetical protein
VVATDAERFDAMLEEFLPDTAALARACLAAVRRLAPGALERVYDAYNALAVGFATGDSMRETFIHVAIYPRHVNIGFNRGVALPDPTGALAGTGSAIRHVKIDAAARLRDGAVVELVRAAAALAGHHGRAGARGPIKIVRVYERRRPRRP